MANSIALVTAFRAVLDAIYKAASTTARMDPLIEDVSFANANVVKVFKTSMVGLGNYSRATGFPVGDVTGTWETMTLAIERGREFTIDRMDNDETLGLAFGTLAGEFYRTRVAPEIDAIRFNKYASASGITEVGTPATLDKTTVLDAIQVAKGILDANEVPDEGRLLYVSDSVYGFIESAVSRQWGSEGSPDKRVRELDGIPVIKVPQTRFYKGLTLDAGATAGAGGFSKTPTTGRDINFLLLHPSAVLQPIKLDIAKIFDPDTNQKSDGWLVQHRLYHDAFVYENKVKGIYSHIKAS